MMRRSLHDLAPRIVSTDVPVIREQVSQGAVPVGTTSEGIVSIDFRQSGHLLVMGRNDGKVPSALLVIALTVSQFPQSNLVVNIDPHGFLQDIPESVTAGSVDDMLEMLSHVHSLMRYRQKAGNQGRRVFVFIDDLRTVLQHIHTRGDDAVDEFMTQLEDILRNGRSSNIHVITAVDCLKLPPRLLAQFSNVAWSGTSAVPTAVKLFGAGEWETNTMSTWVSTSYTQPQETTLFEVPREIPLRLSSPEPVALKVPELIV